MKTYEEILLSLQVIDNLPQHILKVKDHQRDFLIRKEKVGYGLQPCGLDYPELYGTGSSAVLIYNKQYFGWNGEPITEEEFNSYNEKSGGRFFRAFVNSVMPDIIVEKQRAIEEAKYKPHLEYYDPHAENRGMN